jgi:hypothetical protein
MSKKATVTAETLTLKPSEAVLAVKHMILVNMKAAELGEDRRGLFLWGPPGIGKSSLVRQIAVELDMEVVDIRLTQMEPTDLRGIPVPVEENGETLVRWAPPAILPRDPDAKAIIILDELPNAAPSIQAGSYQLVLDGRLGEYVVPKGCIVMAAGNRETDKGSTFKMPTPLMNRFVHVEMRHDFEDFQTYALTKGFHKDVVGYLSAFKHELFVFNATSASRGFATPRSWEAVSAIIRGNPNLPEMVMLGLIAGAVGDGIAVKFIEYRKNAAQLPNPSDILDGRVNELSSREVSLMYALTTAMCYELRDRYDRHLKGKIDDKTFNKNVDNFLGYMLKNFQPELVIMGARTALATFGIQFQPDGMKNWDGFADKYQDIILAA